MTLSDNDIRQFIQSGDILITGFSGELEPASYDLRLGKDALTQDGAVDVQEKKYVKIPRGATAVLYPHEVVKLSTRVAGRFGLRSRFARSGLMLLSGPQIDPGFEGVLSVTVFNAGTTEIAIPYLERFATIEFSALAPPASRPYSGPYQTQKSLSSSDIELTTARYRNLSQIEDALRKCEVGITYAENFIYVVIFGAAAGIVVAILMKLLG